MGRRRDGEQRQYAVGICSWQLVGKKAAAAEPRTENREQRTGRWSSGSGSQATGNRRFDFMFQLNKKEWEILMSQFVISKTEKRGGTQKIPHAFTEQGLAMLSGILNSDKAINVNKAIMRTFVILRQYALGYAELNHKLENFMMDTNLQFNDIYIALTELAEKNKEEKVQRKQIGFRKDS